MTRRHQPTFAPAKRLAIACAALLVAGQTHAAAFSLTLQGSASGFSESQFDYGGLHFDRFDQSLTGLDVSSAINVSQGDVIDATVTFDAPYTIASSAVRTDILQFLTGSTFPSEDTGVTGTFTFDNAGVQVASYDYTSTTSGELSSFAAVFPPANGGFTFTSFTNDFSIVTLATPATLDSSSFAYDLVSNAVSAAPEPETWALMLVGLGLAGALLRRSRGSVVAIVG